jgi:DNA invertase Pin-like site-specific DNA recombinase
MMAKKPKFVAYYRVSDEKTQGRSGLGIEAQSETVARFVASRGGEIIAPEFREVETGKNNERPQLTKAIIRCRKTGATLLVSKLDRLSRDAGFLMTLRNSGVELAAANMPEANTLMFMVMAGMAQQEREYISERTKDALAAATVRRKKAWDEAQAAGYPPPMGPLGGFRAKAPDIRKWQKQGVLAKRVKAQDWAEFHRDDIEPLVGEGKSLRAIATSLNEAGILTPQSKARADGPRKLWSAQGVSNVINRLGIKRPARADAAMWSEA